MMLAESFLLAVRGIHHQFKGCWLAGIKGCLLWEFQDLLVTSLLPPHWITHSGSVLCSRTSPIINSNALVCAFMASPKYIAHKAKGVPLTPNLIQQTLRQNANLVSITVTSWDKTGRKKCLIFSNWCLLAARGTKGNYFNDLWTEIGMAAYGVSLGLSLQKVWYIFGLL